MTEAPHVDFFDALEAARECSRRPARLVCEIAGWPDSIAYSATSEASSGRSASPLHARAQAALSGAAGASTAPPTACAPGAATASFDLHAKLDVEHAAAERALIEPRLDGADRGELVAEAERVLKANGELLDGVERLIACS
jgi:hypothetical protein